MSVRRLLLAKPRGFCAGVDRAIDVVNLALELYPGPVYVRKEIVHNVHVVNDLRTKGAIFVDELDEVPDGATVIFSAHGVSPDVRAHAAARGLKVIDATCPLVTKVHHEAVRFAREGRPIVLVGHQGHDEVVGTMGHAPEHIQLIGSAEEAEALHKHAPMNAVIRFGKRTEEKLIPVKLGVKLTEVGTVEIWCESKISEHRWRLQFELRKAAATQPESKKAGAVISEEALRKAEELIETVFTGADIPPEELPAKLEQALGLGRNSWPLSTIRRLADQFLEFSDARKRSPATEVRWRSIRRRPAFPAWRWHSCRAGLAAVLQVL